MKQPILQTLIALTVVYVASVTTYALVKEWFFSDAPTPHKAAPPSIKPTHTRGKLVRLWPHQQTHQDDVSDDVSYLQRRIREMDATHLIRKYHDRYALFDAEALLDGVIELQTEQDAPDILNNEHTYFDAPDFSWSRIDNARPIDTMRMTFRGNGIPDNVERLAHSKLLQPKLRAFYQSLIRPNTTIWKSPHTLYFNARTFDGKLYKAESTPFIAIQQLSKSEFAKMKSASLPFLWNAYFKEQMQELERIEQRHNPHNDIFKVHGPVEEHGPHLDDYQAFVYPVADKPETLEPNLADDMMIQLTSQRSHQPAQDNIVLDDTYGSIDGFDLDSQTLKQLYFDKALLNAKTEEEADTLRLAMLAQQRRHAFLRHRHSNRHLDRLTQYDPEFSALFLINNLFDQYNIFSTFEEGVSLTINAIDTRLNTIYISYNTRFDIVQDLSDQWLEEGEDNAQFGCHGNAVNISDEFFLVTAQPYSYLIRIYLPDCYLLQEDYEAIDAFLNQIRLRHKYLEPIHQARN